MRRVFLCFLLAAALAAAAAADADGKWSGGFATDNGNAGTAYAVLKVSGASLSGTAGPNADEQWPIQNGKVAGNKVNLEVKSPGDGASYKCDLVVDADHLKGDMTITRPDGQTQKAKMDLTRVK
jgi:hypothetical protein